MKFILDIIKGVFMGVANIIPGVSGGTMAVSMGIYDDIIRSITHLFTQFKKSILTLLPYIIGMGLGLVGLSFLIEKLFESYNFQTNAAFVGLILGGIPILLKRFKGKRVGGGSIVTFVIFFAGIIGFTLMSGERADVVIQINAIEMMKLFLIGVVASATMVIPGVSGSMILLLIGYYNPILSTVTGFLSALKAMDIATAWNCVLVLAPLGIGVIVGIFAIAKLIEMLLKKYEVLTFSAILGLVVSSPFAIFILSGIPQDMSIGTIVGAVICFVAGFGVAYALGRGE